MADYNQQMGSDFFFDFDNYFLWKPDPKTQQAYGKAFAADGIDGFYNQFKKKRKAGTFPDGLISYFSLREEAINFLAEEQFKVLDKHFQNSEINERLAFLDFGQGILFDSRRAKDEYKSGGEYAVIHTMDAMHDPGGYVAPVGYHRWYGFVRVYALLNKIEEGRVLELARNISLAWQIQSKLKPTGSSSDGKKPINPPMDSDELQILREKFSIMAFSDLDALFDHRPFPDSPIV